MNNRVRMESTCNIYHCMMRGAGRQLLFEDRNDYQKMMDLIAKYKERYEVNIIAFCLMNNHVHLMIEVNDLAKLSDFMRLIATCYARHYNCKYDHVGHVFQSRFKSVPVMNEKQLLATVRYIHNNPVKAGFASREEYQWSSYKEYLHEAGVARTDFILSLFSDREDFIAFSKMKIEDDDNVVSFKEWSNLEEGLKIIQGEMGYDLKDGLIVKTLKKEYRDSILRKLKKEGLTTKQIELLTGVSKRIVERA